MLPPRWAVSCLFLVNGFLIGNWAAIIPTFAERLAVDEAALGLLIAVFGLGALIMMPVTGYLIARSGTRVVTVTLSTAASTTLLWVVLAPNVLLAAVALFAFGGLVAAMDVAMNAVAVDVERGHSSPIMSSCHGFWSLGGLFGALIGGYLLEQTGIYTQAITVTALCLGIAILSLGGLSEVSTKAPLERQPIRLPLSILPYLVGVMTLFSALPEGAILDWSALYLRQELGASTFTAALAFGAFSTTMALVRFAGDPIRARFGAVRTVQVSALIAATGIVVAGLAQTPGLAIVGFLISGLGIANLIPIAFSAAGNLPDLPPGIGLSMTTTIGYSGILVAPAAFGFLAKWTSFSTIFVGLAALLVSVFFMGRFVRYADH